MRIIAGKLGGRQFSSKSVATHPMSEKMRGALFNTLGDIKGLSLLDCFAGSGAISFEAVSRGAKHSTAIDSDKLAQQGIKDCTIALRLESEIKLISTTVYNWSSNNVDEKFDLIICDPPYAKTQVNTIEVLPRHLNKKGILVLSWPPKEELPDFETLKLIEKKSYGDSTLVFYQNNK
jgi:16S rRNA (guanine966-N2)-methyltransferase